MAPISSGPERHRRAFLTELQLRKAGICRVGETRIRTHAVG
jgi:hypothetical protein